MTYRTSFDADLQRLDEKVTAGSPLAPHERAHLSALLETALGTDNGSWDRFLDVIHKHEALELAELQRSMRRGALGDAASQRYQEASRTRSRFKAAGLTAEARALAEAAGVAPSHPATTNAPAKAGIGSVIVVALVLLAIFHTLVGSDSLSGSSTCADWLGATAAEKTAYVKHDGYYTDAQGRVAELNGICALTRPTAGGQDLTKGTTLDSLADKHHNLGY